MVRQVCDRAVGIRRRSNRGDLDRRTNETRVGAVGLWRTMGIGWSTWQRARSGTLATEGRGLLA